MMGSSVSMIQNHKSNNIQYGKNNHIEYTWSPIQQERILQLSYQLVRTTDENKLALLAAMFKDCLPFIHRNDEIICRI